MIKTLTYGKRLLGKLYFWPNSMTLHGSWLFVSIKLIHIVWLQLINGYTGRPRSSH